MSNIINLVKMSLSNLNSTRKMILIATIFFMVGSIFSPYFLNLIIGVMVYQCVYQVIAYEENDNIDYLIARLPVTKKEYILSRYLFAIICIIFSIMLFILTYWMVDKFSPKSYELINYELCLASGILSAIVMSSVLIPSILKFGIVKGRMFIVYTNLCIIIFPASIIGELSKKQDGLHILMKLNEVGIFNILFIISLTLLTLSYLTSLKIYNKKEVSNV